MTLTEENNKGTPVRQGFPITEEPELILFVNSCVREGSRTEKLARALLAKLGGEYTEVNLEREGLIPLDGKTLEKRNRLIAAGDYSDPMFRYARQFRDADTVVIAAPFWDMTFPASLKTYLEHLCVIGLVSRYTDAGIPEGMCRAQKLYYVTTSGGPCVPDFGFGQIDVLAKQYFGIPETELIRAEFLDIAGNDADAIVDRAIADL